MSEPDCTNMLKQSEEQLNHHVVVESHLYNNNTGQSSHSQHDEDSFQPQTPITPHSPFTPSLHSPSDLDQLITSKLPQKEETEQNVVSKGNDTNTAIVLRKSSLPKKPTSSSYSFQPLQLLLQECSKEYIILHLATKSEEEMKDLFGDRKKLFNDIQHYCTENVLSSARNKIFDQLDELSYLIQRGKELLKTINSDSDAIKEKFQETVILDKCFCDAMDRIRTENHYYDRRPPSQTDFRPPPPLPPPPPINTNFPRDKLHLPLSHPPLLINRRENTFHHHRNHNDNRRKSSYDRRPDNIRFPREHCPSKLSPIIYEAPPMPPMPPNGPNPPPQSVYDYSQYPPDQQYYHGYYSSYPPELSNSNSNIPYADWQSQNSPVQSMPIHLASFQWNHPGRHTAIPLPTDFMSGPSSAPRLSMPEPHETLGYIKGVIIRDAQGNIGLSQYTFNTL
ncbi:1038_t:CDS:2 [Entrophospora sp. SA101]|nr:1038_t:CDS:2 [Entrophospora sp. SA101]